jgi:hypothetical protein
VTKNESEYECVKINTRSLSKQKVFVTANAQPASKARRIIEAEVVGVADARPNGFKKCIPAKSTEISTRSTGVKKFGSAGSLGMGMP